jgi:SAM-dependent methyltransferase
MPPDEAGEFLLRLVEEKTGLDLAASDVLDIGCGTRFAASIINRGLNLKSYTGIDINKDLITFLQGATSEIDNMKFHYWHVKNELYNPDGEEMTERSVLPIGDQKFDIVCFFSVFTHLTPADANTMLELARKVMKPSSRLFLTAFVSKAQKELFVDVDPSKPLFKALFRKSYFDEIVDNRGLAIEYFGEPTKLSAFQYVLRLK